MLMELPSSGPGLGYWKFVAAAGCPYSGSLDSWSSGRHWAGSTWSTVDGVEMMILFRH